MRCIPLGAVACLCAGATAQTPISYSELEAKARPAPELWQVESRLREGQAQLQESRGFLREGPSLAFQAGPRRGPGPTTTDTSLELELPLFLSSGARRELEASLGQAHPLLREAAQREARFRLRTAYLEAWLAQRLLELRERDLATVERWRQAAKTRFEAGSDPEFQVALVEGEGLKARQELAEARSQLIQARSRLSALAELAPGRPLADPEPENLPTVAPNLEDGPLHQALRAQLDLETQRLKLKEHLALSRWSLRASHAREGDEQVSRVGIALRLPRPGERESLRGQTEAQVRQLQGETRLAQAELEARVQNVRARLQALASEPPPPDFSRALIAVELRLQEGRERASEALPIRRQLLEAQMATLRAAHAHHLLCAELQALSPKDRP